MPSLYAAGLVKGIGEAGGVLAGSLMQQARRDEQDDARRRMEELRQQDRLELLAARQAAAGGAGRAGGKASGGFTSPEEMESVVAAGMGKSVLEYRAWREQEQTGDYSGSMVEQTVPASGNTSQSNSYNFAPAPEPVTQKVLPDGFMTQKRQERAKYQSLIETYRFSGEIKDIAEARGTETRTGLLKDVAATSGADDALLLDKGKDPLETAARAEKARADALESGADARLRDRTTDPSKRAGGKGGGGGGSMSDKTADQLTRLLTQKRLEADNADKLALKFMDPRDPAAKQARESAAAARASMATIEAALREKLRIASPPASPTAPPAAPKPAGGDQFTVGKTYKDGKGNVAKYLGNGKWEASK